MSNFKLHSALSHENSQILWGVPEQQLVALDLAVLLTALKAPSLSLLFPQCGRRLAPSRLGQNFVCA